MPVVDASSYGPGQKRNRGVARQRGIEGTSRRGQRPKDADIRHGGQEGIRSTALHGSRRSNRRVPPLPSQLSDLHPAPHVELCLSNEAEPNHLAGYRNGTVHERLRVVAIESQRARAALNRFSNCACPVEKATGSGHLFWKKAMALRGSYVEPLPPTDGCGTRRDAPYGARFPPNGAEGCCAASTAQSDSR